MKKEIVLVLIMLISFPVMADELVESQSLAQAISELTSATENEERILILSEQTSGGQTAVSLGGRAIIPDPMRDYRKNKPQYQSITVLKSTIPEVQEGSVFKSNTYGVQFYYNDYWLLLNKKADYFLNEFGDRMQKDLYQWEFSNFNLGSTRSSSRHGASFTTPEGISIPIISFMSKRILVSEPMVYPLRLTNDLHVIEFAAPQELAAPKKEN